MRKYDFLFIVFWLIGSPKLFANPLEGIMGGGKERVKLELKAVQDTYELEEKKESGEEKYSHLSGKFHINFYKGEEWTWFTSAKSDRLDIGLDEIFVGETDVKVKGILYDNDISLGFKKSFNDESSIGVSASYGSASDDPFEDSRDTTINATATYAFAPQIESQWILFVNYANNRAFLNGVPIPAFAYIYRPRKGFMASFGLPFVSMSWSDHPNYNVNLFLSPAGGGLDAGFGIAGPVQAYSNFTYSVKSYMHSERVEDEDRLFVEQKKVSVGLRSPLSRWLSFKLGAGLGFDRVVYEGEGLFEEHGNKTRLENDIFLESKLTIKF